MNKFIAILMLLFVTLVSSCKFQKMDPKFYNKQTVGVAVIIYEPTVQVVNASNIINFTDYKNTYYPILKNLNTNISKDSVTSIITKNLETNNKKYKFIEYFNYNDLSKFKSRNPDRLKEYSRRELRNFKKSHDIDQIIVLRIEYGIAVILAKAGVVLTYGAFDYKNEVVDLQDNSLYQRKFKSVGERVKGSITPEKLEIAVNNAIEKGFNELKQIYK